MLRLRLPKMRLGFLKKLLPKKPETEAVTVPVDDIGPSKQKKEKSAVQELPLEECPICHDPVGVMSPEGILESWVHLHCKHKFGSHCIQTWLQESTERDVHSVPSCPICRTTAKHPCGHPVVLLGPPSPLWASYLPSSRSPSPPYFDSRRARRRLSRRLGHPHRPPPPRPARSYVQTVGVCDICTAAAAAEEKRARLETAGGATHTSRILRTENTLSGIKFKLLPASFRRFSNVPPDTAYNRRYDAFLDAYNERARLPPLVPINHREYLNHCRTEIVATRSPTPAPMTNRVFSF